MTITIILLIILAIGFSTGIITVDKEAAAELWNKLFNRK